MSSAKKSIALQDLAPIELLALAELVRARIERLFPARAEQLVDLPAALRELAVSEDALLANLHAANAAREPRT